MISSYLADQLLQFLTGDPFIPPSTFYIALCTSTPISISTGSTIPEISGGNYVRQAVNANMWQTAAGAMSNINPITWDITTWEGTVTSVAICDLLFGGNLLFFGDLSSPRSVAVTDAV